jgi:hypothetical protein
MALFDQPKTQHPRQWKDMSRDFKSMFVYHSTMVVLFITGGAFSLKQEISVACVIVAVLVAISLRHRHDSGWHWRRPTAKNFLMVAGVIVFTPTFLYVASRLFSPLNPQFAPWFLAGGGIGLFQLLSVLQLVRTSEAEFHADCLEVRDTAAPSTSSIAIDPVWKRAVRAFYYVVFMTVWLGGMTFFYVYGVATHRGSPVPTATQTELIVEHGSSIFVTREEKLRVDRWEMVMTVGIPSILASGFIIHFLLGIKLFNNAPTLAEWRARRQSQ